eukprot:GFUD01016735.1.p1 GENE.GFUD01016735.1~~GFUD01016735.1.p1  ORF type:complete len:224 (-),score=44.32 GFUD01016735.1:93-719(-)
MSLHKQVLRERCPSFDRVGTNRPFNNTVITHNQSRVSTVATVAKDNKSRPILNSFKQDQFDMNMSLHKHVLRERCPSFDRVETNEPFNNTVITHNQSRVSTVEIVAKDNKSRPILKSFKRDQFDMNMSLHKHVFREQCPSFDRVGTNEPFNNTVKKDIQLRLASVAIDNISRPILNYFKQDQFDMNMSLHKHVLRVRWCSFVSVLTTQ